MSLKREPRLDPSRMEDGKGTWLVVGSSNPGIEYAQTHHNHGYMVASRFVESVGGKYRNQSLGRGDAMAKVAGICLEYDVSASQVTMVRTGAYMDASGPVVGQLLKFCQINTAHLVVVYDDIDLNFRYAKLKVGGSNGGHSGLKSIQQTLGTKDSVRLCIGVGHPPNRELGRGVVNWVLGQFPKSEKTNLEEFFDQAVQCINDVAESDLVKA